MSPGQWEFMGFGGGSRACLGRQKSLLEAASWDMMPCYAALFLINTPDREHQIFLRGFCSPSSLSIVDFQFLGLNF
ncbi:hypothetical protein F4823DRAFT_569794 [Ustulina deusta]|nr:hypothetical protein F4823DRAFT_569794 [Ustulina deusta]